MPRNRQLINNCLAAYLKMLRYRTAKTDVTGMVAMLTGVAIGLEMAEGITRQECLRLLTLINNAEHYARLGTGRASQ